ncbi:MAG: hypothetical protein GYA60_03325 [Candidatus Methanofastidiosa archaeon]|nr:hypothetical protein [Candidatus Methanofastidiosa archaeon]
MRKSFALTISLLLLVSVFGIISTMAIPNGHKVTATPDKVKVGELITVTTNFYSEDPTIIADGNIPKGDAVLVSRPQLLEAGGPDETYTWVYRATQAGTIRFDFSGKTLEAVIPRVSNPVTITKASYPMNKFMNILGFGTEGA